MTRSFKLGAHSSTGSAMTTMPYPTEYNYTIQHIGGVHNTAASVYQDTFDRRHTWQYGFRMLTVTELGTVASEFNRDTTLDMTPVEIDDATYYNVIIVGGFSATPVHTGTVGSPYFDLSLTFQET